ncbi:MAG: hypothetical protein M3082_19225 [Candidatus Dormibacteraeota bacterium]|nr:hypothetical protein [Candidatus Dormibacteraeota bacterium]
MTADISEELDARPTGGLRRVVLPLLALVIGAVIGFGGRSWLASPSDVVVDGHPSTLHVYRFDPTTKASPVGAVIFNQATISKVAAELNGLPAFPKSGRSCDKDGLYVALTFSYDNGDSATVNVRSAPCGMVTKYGDEKVVADALGSSLYEDLAALLPSNP